jgi:hypothetical protein
VVVESKFYFYGTKLKKEDAQRIAENIQKMWNSANGKVTIDGKEYNVKFKITATAIVKKTKESDEDYTMRVGKMMTNLDMSTHDTYNDDIKNNWVRIEDENPSDKYGTKTSQNSGFWLTSDAYNAGASHEYWEGLNMTGEDHLKDCSGDGARIRCAKNGKIVANTRIVTQDDINDLKLGDILSGGKKSGAVGFFGNVLYRKNGAHEVVGDTKEKNARLKSERGQ